MLNDNAYTITNFKNAKVLIAENNDDQWHIIQQAMRQCMSEITVQRVSSAEQARTLLQEWHYHEWEIPKLILLDLYMPSKADGWHLLKQVKTMSSNIRRTPVVMLTSSTDKNDIKEAYQQGITACMMKPNNSADWLTCFCQLRTYWFETVTLPQIQYHL